MLIGLGYVFCSVGIQQPLRCSLLTCNPSGIEEQEEHQQHYASLDSKNLRGGSVGCSFWLRFPSYLHVCDA